MNFPEEALKEPQDVHYCYPLQNTSCVREVRSTAEYIVMYIFFGSLSLFTVFLNLLVIVSISHFKQLHAPTNMLILSLAVADLLVGLIVIPVEGIKLIQSCWYFGQQMCTVFKGMVYIIVFASLYSLVVIAVDRYIAVCDPLVYYSKITMGKTNVSIILIWAFSITYNVTILYCNAHWNNNYLYTECYGECALVVSFTWGIVDLFFSFVMPCSILICLYIKIFKVARNQVKIINSISNRIQVDAGIEQCKISERKATKTLGVVVLVYLVSWITHYVCALSLDSLSNSSNVIAFLSWVLFINAAINPLIYASFYPWFKTSVKCIITLRIFAPASSDLCLTPGNC